MHSKYLYSCSKEDFDIKEYTDVRVKKLDDLVKLFPTKFAIEKNMLQNSKRNLLELWLSVQKNTDYDIYNFISKL